MLATFGGSVELVKALLAYPSIDTALQSDVSYIISDHFQFRFLVLYIEKFFPQDGCTAFEYGSTAEIKALYTVRKTLGSKKRKRIRMEPVALDFE